MCSLYSPFIAVVIIISLMYFGEGFYFQVKDGSLNKPTSMSANYTPAKHAYHFFKKAVM